MDRNLIENVQKLRKEGKSFGEIAKELLITKSSACYCSKINLNEYDEKTTFQRKYINYVCELAKKCTNINQILKILGKKSTNEYYKQIKKILEENNVDTSHFTYNEKYKPNGIEEKKSLSDYLVIGSAITISKLRNRLIKEGVKEHKCEKCGRTEWEGEIIPLQLHHINGDRTDNRLENLQLLCPNCHALTDNYCGKKSKKKENICPICGRVMAKKSKLCKHCFQNLFKNKKIDIVYNNGELKIDEAKKIKYKIQSKCPSKEELLDSFKLYGSFRSVGKIYGVSDKAVSKWCNKLSLPTKAIEMRKFLRETYGSDLKWDFNNGNKDTLKKYQSFKQPKRCLIGYNGNIEKIYNNEEEIKNDGFDPKNVLRVCKGELETHHHRKFKFLEDV